MVLTEKVKFNGVNTEISPGAVDNGGNRMIVNPMRYALNARYLSSEAGEELIAESIKGNTKITNASLPAGTNKCIGWGESKELNCIYYFIYNSNNNHSIFKFVPETQAITLLIQKSVLNFQNDRRYLINSVSCINGLVIWDDGYNMTGIIKDGRDYTYPTFEESHIRLIKKQPSVAPKVNYAAKPDNDGQVYYRGSSAATVANLMSDRNFQFSYRLVFLDKELSVLAPYSTLSIGERYPELESQQRSVITVRIDLTDAISYVDKIQVLYRGSTEDTWKVFANLAPISGSVYTVDFTGTEFIEEIAESESSKIFESIPNFSSASCIQKNRLFVTEDESGFDTTHPTISSITRAQFGNNVLERAWLPGGRKKIGIAVFDKDHRSIGIVEQKDWTNVFQYNDIFNIQDLVNHSTSSVLVGTGNKTFILFDKAVVQLTFANVSTGDMAYIYNPDLTNGINFVMIGRVTSKNNSTGQITVNVTSASGPYVGNTYSNWTIEIVKTGPSGRPVGYAPDVTLSGSFQVGGKAKYYSLAVSDDLFYDEYIEVPVRPYFYKFDKTGNYTPSSTTERVIDGKVFTTQKPSSGDAYSKVYLQLPRETPISIDTSFYVRLINGVSTVENIQSEKVLAVDGDWIVVNNFNVNDWSANSDVTSGADNFIIKVAIFRIKNSEEVVRYFEATPRYQINNDGTIPVTSFPKLKGDCYLMSNNYTFRSFRNNPAYQKKTTAIFTVLSRSGVGSIANIADRDAPKEKGLKKLNRLVLGGKGIDELSDIKNKRERFNKFLPENIDKFSGDNNNTRITSVLTNSDGLSAAARNYVVDYTMADWAKGIPLIEIEESKRIFRSGTKIRYSNKFIQDTNINGLNSFDAGNAHSLSSERGRIKRLVPVGNNILAVHERACTSLYIEEGIIRGADGGGTLVTTNNVIGHDQKMIMEYGAYHGESVVKNDLGHVFGFDVYKGVAWRYTNEGLAKISADVDTDFQALGQEYLAIKDTCRIVGGIDPANKEYILTFRKDDGTGVTWVFNYEKGQWQGNYSFIPEMYANIGNNIIAFKDGELWLQNATTTYNNFFGVQYDRVMKIAVNPYPGTKKMFNGIIIAAQKLSEDNNEVIARFYCGDQESYSMFDEFDLKQGLHIGPILRDINTPNMDPSLLALRDGDFMFGEYIMVELICSLPERLPIRFFDITYNKSEFSK